MEKQKIVVEFDKFNDEEVQILGNTLKEMRRNTGMSQQTLSEKIMKDRTGLSKYEQAQTIPTLQSLNDIAKSLGYKFKIVFEEECDNPKVFDKENKSNIELNDNSVVAEDNKLDEVKALLTAYISRISLLVNISNISDRFYNDCVCDLIDLEKIEEQIAMDYDILKSRYDLNKNNILNTIKNICPELLDGSLFKGMSKNLNELLSGGSYYDYYKTEIVDLNECSLSSEIKECISDIICVLRIGENIKMIDSYECQLSSNEFEDSCIGTELDISVHNYLWYKWVSMEAFNTCKKLYDRTYRANNLSKLESLIIGIAEKNMIFDSTETIKFYMSYSYKDKLYELASNKLSCEKTTFLKLIELLERSLKNSEDRPLCAIEQYEYIERHLRLIVKKEAIAISNTWRELCDLVRSVEWYDNMREISGGIVDGGDDTFYMDFGSWLASRGPEFLVNYLEFGRDFVMSYILKNRIPESEYTFECMAYAFQNE